MPYVGYILHSLVFLPCACTLGVCRIRFLYLAALSRVSMPSIFSPPPPRRVLILRMDGVQARALSAAGRMDPRAVALLQSQPRLRAAFEHAKHNRGARLAMKQQLTILCDEGRSHPEYWSLKTELDNVDGGEDDSDVLDADGSFNDIDFGDSMDMDDKLHSLSVGSQLSNNLDFKDTGMGDSFGDNDIIQDY